MLTQLPERRLPGNPEGVVREKPGVPGQDAGSAGGDYTDYRDRKVFKRAAREKVLDFKARMAVLERKARQTPEGFRVLLNRRLSVLRCQCYFLSGQVNSIESAPREIWGLLQREIYESIRRMDAALSEREAGMRIDPGRTRYR
ncbi:MAG: hypothetical protein ACYC5N_08255 [Endomicrobiales bacterium]